MLFEFRYGSIRDRPSPRRCPAYDCKSRNPHIIHTTTTLRESASSLASRNQGVRPCHTMKRYLLAATSRKPWNKGKLIGAKPPLRPKNVWTIRTRLVIERRSRDLAMFKLAIDSKLRGCDVVALMGGGRCAQRLPDRSRHSFKNH